LGNSDHPTPHRAAPKTKPSPGTTPTKRSQVRPRHPRGETKPTPPPRDENGPDPAPTCPEPRSQPAALEGVPSRQGGARNEANPRKRPRQNEAKPAARTRKRSESPRRARAKNGPNPRADHGASRSVGPIIDPSRRPGRATCRPGAPGPRPDRTGR